MCSVEKAQDSHLYSYVHGFRGFAAKLTQDQASQMASKPHLFLLYASIVLHIRFYFSLVLIFQDYYSSAYYSREIEFSVPLTTPF